MLKSTCINSILDDEKKKEAAQHSMLISMYFNNFHPSKIYCGALRYDYVVIMILSECLYTYADAGKLK